MSDLLTEQPTECLAPVRDLLDALTDLGITPASLTVEWRFTNQTQPYINCWIRYRTEFERLTEHLKLKTDSAVRVIGQRHYFTRGDKGPLIQCVSFPHHEDWEATA